MLNAERHALLGLPTAQRSVVLAIVEGLDHEQLHTSVTPSGWTPGSMLRHLAEAEAYWCQHVLSGTQQPSNSPDAAAEVYREQIRTSDSILATLGLDDPPLGTTAPAHAELAQSVRTVVLHLIEETARHAGHLDIARERIDGTAGPGPR
jgi:uncharacterized damage-inducible protein DinB